MRTYFLLLSCVCFTFFINAQIFTRLTTGDLVNDSGSSFGHSWCDFNNDGWEDIYVNNLASGQENFFYQNNGDGTFTRLTDLIITQSNASTSSTWADFNNDGWMDLFVTNGGTVLNQAKNDLFLNNGNGSFMKVTTGAIVNQQSAFTACSWIDVNQDGHLDLFVGRSFGSNSYFRSDGLGGFIHNQLLDAAGTWGVSWADYDNDGDMDGFATNWSAPNYFYRNDDGNLNNVNNAPLTSGSFNSLSPSWGDYDNDGWMDLFVANSGAKDRLFHNDGDGTFTQITSSPVVNFQNNSEGSCWLDWDNDGDLDLMVAAGGNISTGTIFMYENDGLGNFIEVAEDNVTNLIGRYEGLTCVDYDQDGDLDVFVSNYFNNDNLLFQNNGNENTWVTISLIGVQSNRNGIGTRVRIKAIINGIDVWQIRDITTASGHVTQGSLKAHFGLGNATNIDSIEVRWPSGVVDVFSEQDLNQFYTITEGETQPNSTRQTFNEKMAIRLQVAPNPFLTRTTISYQLTTPANVSLQILDIQGALVSTLFKGNQLAGNQSFKWGGIDKKGQKVARGFYLLHLKIGTQVFVEKILLN